MAFQKKKGNIKTKNETENEKQKIIQINRNTNKLALDKMKMFDNIECIFLISRKEKKKEKK